MWWVVGLGTKVEAGKVGRNLDFTLRAMGRLGRIFESGEPCSDLCLEGIPGLRGREQARGASLEAGTGAWGGVGSRRDGGGGHVRGEKMNSTHIQLLM